MKSLLPWCKRNRYELLLAGVALLLYALGIGWGWPSGVDQDQVRPWGHDDVMPLGPLAEIQNTFVHPAPNRYLGYPLLQYFLVALAYGPYLVSLKIAGLMAHPGPVYPYGLVHPAQTLQILTLIARSMSVLMAAALVFAACQVGKVLWGRATGLIAGVNVMLLYPMFYYSRTGNFDVPYMFWATLGLWAYALMIRDEFTVWRGIALGACAACAAGTKDQAAAIFLLMPVVLVPLHIMRIARKKSLHERRIWLAPLATVVSGLLVYLVASGFAFRPERYFAHVRLITSGLSFPSYPATLTGYAGLFGEVIHLLSDGMSPVMLIVSAVGIVVALARDRLGLALLVPAVSMLAFFTIPVRFVEMRYIMPVMVVLACFAAYPIGLAISSRHAWLRGTSIAILCAVCAVPALQGLQLTYLMRNDSRYSAARWLEERVRPEERIGYFSVGNHLPRIRAGLQYIRVDHFPGTRLNVHYTAEDIQQMGSFILEKNPEFLLVIPDQSAVPGLPFGLTVPPELYRQLEDGTIGYRKAVHFQTPPLAPSLRTPDLVDYYDVVNPPVDIFVKISRQPEVSRAGQW